MVIKREDGFSLVELMITMVVFVLVIAAASGVFTGLLTQFKQQSKIAETNIEGIVGLEILRQDIEHAGYGLPWNGLISYSESSDNPFSLNDAPTGVPKPIISANDATYASPNNIFDNADYLVIKAVNVARNDACEKWTTLSSASPYVRTWTPSTENLASTDRVIVLSPGTTDTNARTLIVDGANFYTTFGNVTSSPWLPTDNTETHIVYGINSVTANAPVRPFNRADYSIRRPSTMPARCAPNTGILYKATMDHNSSGTFDYLPLLDCVADMQVIYGFDNDNDEDFEPGVVGSTDGYIEDLTGYSAAVIRDQVKQVRVYILAHEGQKDTTHTYPSSSISLGGDVGLGETVNLSTRIGTGWQNYRWKVYTIVAKPDNLR